VPEKAKVAVTLGDPAGVGPEVVLKVLADPSLRAACTPVVLGLEHVVEAHLPFCGAAAKTLKIRSLARFSDARGEPGTVEVLPTGSLAPADYAVGAPTAASGTYSGDCVRRAAEVAMRGEAAGLVMAPIHKKALNDGGYHYAGFKELMDDFTHTKESIQILMGKRFSASLMTLHVPLKSVPALCTRPRVLAMLRLLDASLRTLGFAEPRIAVAGLNPHCGEQGLLGTEEIEHIVPAMEEARRDGIAALGPYPSDTVFRRMAEGEFDIVLSMYHDHALTVLKLMEFGSLVNVMGGLPILAFTVTHGTALDIAGKGVAIASDMKYCLLAAAGQDWRR
jgi:4-phospho-D-threonate 3-dehydrogenase / 4-phospho-D-erythronate 3-dehydrogenase